MNPDEYILVRQYTPVMTEAWHGRCKSQFGDGRERRPRRKGKASGNIAASGVHYHDGHHGPQSDRLVLDRGGFGRHLSCRRPERTQMTLENGGTRG